MPSLIGLKPSVSARIVPSDINTMGLSPRPVAPEPGDHERQVGADIPQEGRRSEDRLDLFRCHLIENVRARRCGCRYGCSQ